MLRPRHPDSSPDAGARIRGLLAAPGGGWVPPPDGGPSAEAVWPGWTHTSPAPPPEVSWSDGLDDAADPVTQTSVSWDATPSARHAAAGQGLADLLPLGLRTARIDAGRRAVVALVVVALLGAAVAGAVVLRGRPQEVVVTELVTEGVPLPGSSPTAAPAGSEVVVAVGGKVRKPGLVRLPLGSRVDDAVRAAGGLQAGASSGLLNLARKLVDGEQVLVGVEPEPGGAPIAGGLAPAASGGLLDLNVAGVGDFDALPGIGPVLAQRIVDWRTEHGRFASVDQLREVTGIGEAKFADLRDKVTA